MKRLYQFFFLLLALILPDPAIAYDFEVDGIYYNVDGNTATVTYKQCVDFSYQSDYNGDITIPETVTYNGTTYSVIAIDNYAFYNCSGLTSIDIPNNVTDIDYYAFCGCSSLTSIDIPNSVTHIGNYAFYGCSSITSATIGSAVSYIGNYAFQGCISLETLNFNAVTCADFISNSNYRPFNGLNISTINIGDSVQRIPAYFVYGLKDLVGITIGKSVTTIGYDAFNNCSGLTDLVWNAKNCVTNSGMTTTNIVHVTIGNEVEMIPSYFVNESKITEITIPNSVTTIGDCAFYNCSGLTNVSIPNSATTIGSSAFSGCSGLTSVVIGNSVTTIGDGAFSYCSDLTSITIPNPVTSIGSSAFYNCNALTCVNITDIAAWCNIHFADYSSNPLYYAHHLYLNGREVTDLTIPNSVITINDYAFYYCCGITTVDIPYSVEAIGNRAFADCENLNIVKFGNAVSYIDDYAFCNCNALKNVNIPNSVTYIGEYAFAQCYELTDVTIGDSVTTIGGYAFYDCYGLTSVKIGKSVVSIGERAFCWCYNLKHLLWNAVNCTTIGNIAFSTEYYNTTYISVYSMQFGNNVEYIPDRLPSISMSGKVLIIPNNVKKIDARAIRGNCDAVVIGNGIENIPASTFSNGICVAYVTAAEPQPCEAGAFANPQTLFVPAGSKMKYFTATGWSEFANIIEGEYVPATAIELDKDSIRLCKDASMLLNATVLPDTASATSIGWYTMNPHIASVGDGMVYANGVGETDIIVWVDQVSDTCHVTVTPIMVQNITLSTNHLSMSLDETYTLTANASPVNAENLTLEWEIPENDVLLTQLVNNNNLNIGAAGEGAVTITVRATDGSGVSASCEVFVSANTPVKNLTVSPETMTLYVGYSEQLNATITPQDAYTQELRWFSNNTEVATVDSYGMVTGRSVGTATITAVTTDGSNLSATCAVTVTNIPVESVTLDYNDIEMYAGDYTYLYAYVEPNNAMNQTLRWESSNPRVATVTSNGRVNALEVGTTIITATSTDGTDISAACRITVRNYTSSNCFSMPDTAVLHGESVTIPVRLTNDQDILAFQTNIYLPEGFSMATDENDEFLITPSSRLTSNHVIMADRFGDGGVRVICYTPQETPISGNEGDLFYITITAPEYAAHDYAINLRNSLLTNTDYQELTIPDAGAVLTVETYMMGDVNDSHSVTVTDIVVTAQHVLGRNPSPFIFEAADMNGDGNVTVTDIMLIAYLINHPTMNTPKRMPALMNVGDRMSGEDVTLMAGETRTVSIVLDNMTDYTAFQLDLTLPEGLTASNFQLTNRACSHALDVNTMGNGKTRALCYSPAIEAISGHEGALLTFDVTATSGIEGIITVDGIEMVTADYQTALLDGFTIGVNSVTSVNEIAGAKAVLRVDYFNLAGQQIDRPETGVTLVVTTYTDGTRSTTKVIK